MSTEETKLGAACPGWCGTQCKTRGGFCDCGAYAKHGNNEFNTFGCYQAQRCVHPASPSPAPAKPATYEDLITALRGPEGEAIAREVFAGCCQACWQAERPYWHPVGDPCPRLVSARGATPGAEEGRELSFQEAMAALSAGQVVECLRPEYADDWRTWVLDPDGCVATQHSGKVFFRADWHTCRFRAKPSPALAVPRCRELARELCAQISAEQHEDEVTFRFERAISEVLDRVREMGISESEATVERLRWLGPSQGKDGT